MLVCAQNANSRNIKICKIVCSVLCAQSELHDNRQCSNVEMCAVSGQYDITKNMSKVRACSSTKWPYKKEYLAILSSNVTLNHFCILASELF